MNGQSEFTEAPQAFPHTRWSVVLAATQRPSSEAAEALEAICRAYWYPLYAFARRCGHAPPDAQDLTQEFFFRLIEKRWLDAADREKGRLRSFLIVALKNLMANEWRRTAALRRGGRKTHVPIDTVFAESRYAADPHAGLAADDVFDRQWALTLLERSVERLRAEFAAAGKPGDFDVLKGSLMAERGAIDYAAAAAGLGISEAAARVAVHRLRKRFRAVFREEISQTLADDADLDGEVRHLAAALARQ